KQQRRKSRTYRHFPFCKCRPGGRVVPISPAACTSSHAAVALPSGLAAVVAALAPFAKQRAHARRLGQEATTVSAIARGLASSEPDHILANLSDRANLPA